MTNNTPIDSTRSGGDVVLSPKVKRTRRGGSRSKTGCITCRLRRVKCDETKPICVRCTNSRRICEGFPSIFATSKPWEVIQDPSLGSMIKPCMNPRVASNDHAMQSFRFFEKMTIPILAEVFGGELWAEALPRAALHCPVIWHATVALGSAHESHALMTSVPGGVSESKLDWTVEQYNRAIRVLTNDNAVKQCRTDVAIVASVIFMVFEVTRHEFAKALGHAKSGINMFREYRQELKKGIKVDPGDEMIPISRLERSLRLMEVQLCELTLDHEGPITLTLTNMFDRSLSTNHQMIERHQSEFSTFADARAELGWYWHNLMKYFYFVFEAGNETSVLSPIALRDEQAYYHDAVTEWFRKYAAFLQAAPATRSPAEQLHIVRLERYGLLFLQMVAILSLRESDYDEHTEDFDDILDRCREWIAAYLGSNGGLLACNERYRSNEHNCAFQINTGVVAVVFHVFWRCRTARIRQKALTILANYPRRAFLWDSPMAIDICNHIDELERGTNMLAIAAIRDASSAEITPWRRVRTISLNLNNADQCSELTYVIGQSPTGDADLSVKKLLAWGDKGVFG